MDKILEFVELIINTPIYTLLFGSGGILIILLTLLKLKKKKADTTSQSGSIVVKNSEETKVIKNTLKDQSITVEDSKKTTIQDNQG